MTQDEIYAKQAIELAHTAARALEEAESYIEDIKNEKLREATEIEVERIIQEV